MNTHLASLLENLPHHRVLCVGDVMLDRYIYGHVDRISPEAPIPVLRIEREAVTLGGAGNVVRNIVSLGGEAVFVSVVGDDQAGQQIDSLLTALPQVTAHLLTDTTRPTTLKTRYIAEGQQLLRADHEISSFFSASMEQQLIQRVHDVLDGCKVIILSDYAKGVLSPSVVTAIIMLAKDTGCKVLIDPKGRDYSPYHGATMLTPNRKELAEITGTPIRNVQDAEKASRQLIATYHLQGVLAKLGSDGVCLVMRDEPALPFSATAREVFDVSGAGDTVVSTLALALAGGLTPADGAALANIAGSIVVGKIGTAAVTSDELKRELTSNQNRRREDKVSTLAHAAECAERWRKQGMKVGFTNGCFDLLHPGHIALLHEAKSACDKLIVGINSDASVKRLKGETRPVQNENDRAAVLASLADVDLVVIFNEDTPLELIKTLRPAVLVKGADYSLDQVVGGDLVQAWGGKVVLANLIDGHSTTATIARLKKP